MVWVLFFKKNNVLKLQETLQADLEYWDPELLIQN